MASLASTSIKLSNQKEDLAVVDVYKQNNTTKTINKAPVLSPEAASAAEGYRNNPSLVKTIADKVKGFIPTDVPSAIDTIDRLSKLTNDLKTPFNKMSSATLSEIIAGFGLDANSPMAKVVIGGVEYKNKKFKDVSSFANFLSALTGDADIMKVLDIQGQGALFTVLLKQAIELGLPEAIDAIIEKVTDAKLKKKLLIASLEDAARASDLKTVNKIIDEIGATAALTKTPNLIQIILMFYTHQKPRRKIAEEVSELVNLLVRINAKWDKGMRAGVEIHSLEPFAYASNAALSLLITDDRYRMQAMIGNNFKSEQLMRLLRKSYPRAGFRDF